MHLSASPVHCHGMSDSRDSVCVVLGPAFQEMGGGGGLLVQRLVIPRLHAPAALNTPSFKTATESMWGDTWS